MRALWKGSISFGLVNIPVGLYPATRREELKFRLLREKDLSPVNYKRVAAVDGKEVPWEQIVKGYEYEKDRFVVLKEDDFKRVDVEATQTVDIIDFVRLEEVNPMYFQKPYYLEPQKGGAPAYALLRDVLAQTGKAGIAKVVIRTKQHLAALKPNGDVLVLELMHFGDELVDAEELKVPSQSTKPGKRELDMAKNLVEQMTVEWDPSRYKDDYTSSLMKMIEEKIAKGGKAPAATRARKSQGNVIDLVAALQESLDKSGSGSKRRAAARDDDEDAPPKKTRKTAKKAAKKTVAKKAPPKKAAKKAA